MLWSGSWSSGSITASGASEYSLFICCVRWNGSDNPVVVARNGSIMQGVGTKFAGSVYLLTVQCSISGDVLSGLVARNTPLNNGGSQTATEGVTRVYGLL